MIVDNQKSVELARYIARQYQTKTVKEIHEGMLITHPGLNLSESQVGGIIRDFKRSFDRRVAQCLANNQYIKAAAIEALKLQLLPDKRSKFKPAVDQVVDQDIIQNIVDEEINIPNMEDNFRPADDQIDDSDDNIIVVEKEPNKPNKEDKPANQ